MSAATPACTYSVYSSCSYGCRNSAAELGCCAVSRCGAAVLSQVGGYLCETEGCTAWRERAVGDSWVTRGSGVVMNAWDCGDSGGDPEAWRSGCRWLAGGSVALPPLGQEQLSRSASPLV